MLLYNQGGLVDKSEHDGEGNLFDWLTFSWTRAIYF